MDYGCEQVEDVVTSITVIGAVDTNGMSALVKCYREEHVALSSPKVSPMSGDAEKDVDSL